MSATPPGGPASTPDDSGYMPHLDGIRAFAVGAVIVEHWASGMPRPIKQAVAGLDLGAWGVECFFVLSGFLITQILLQAKEKHTSLATAIGHFYGRRALRIFPAYYLLLVAAALVSPAMRDAAWWHALYLGNFYPLRHDGFPAAGGHFWSLAVEEQYYLVWPLLVLLAPASRIIHVAVAACILGPLTRLALWYAMDGVHLAMWTVPTTALDLLAFGALLASAKRRFGLQVTSPFVVRLGWLGLAAIALYASLFVAARDSGAFVVVARMLTALIFGALVLRASFGFSGAVAAVLGNRVVVWLGIVSYGLYLLHPFIPDLYRQLLAALDLPPALWGLYPIRIPLMTLMLLGITAASFYLWEQPIRRFRRLLA